MSQLVKDDVVNCLNDNRTFRPFDVSPLHWTFRPLDVSPPGRFVTWTFRRQDFSLLDVSSPGRFAHWLDVLPPTADVSPPVCFSMCLLFFRTPEHDGRVDRQNCYQYLASVWWHAMKMKTKIITTRFPRTRTEFLANWSLKLGLGLSSLLSCSLRGRQLLNCLALRPQIGPNALPLINQKPNDKGEGLYPP